jgi:hypothetical protein
MPPIYYVPPADDTGGRTQSPQAHTPACDALDALRTKKKFAADFQLVDQLHLTESADRYPNLAVLPEEKDFSKLVYDCYQERTPVPSWLQGLDEIGYHWPESSAVTIDRSSLATVDEWQKGTETVARLRHEALDSALFDQALKTCGQAWPVKIFGMDGGNGFMVKNDREVYLTNPNGAVIYGPDVVSSYSVIHETIRRLHIPFIGDGLSYYLGLDSQKTQVTCANSKQPTTAAH